MPSGGRFFTENEDNRWKQRFINLSHAYTLLAELDRRELSELTVYERESYAHRFFMVVDLAWKTILDYLVYAGVDIPVVTPRSVVKEAFAAGVIQEGETFLEMIKTGMN